MRALIVQRNEHLGGMWKRHLERLNVNVTLVHTGEAALNELYVTPFDVIVLDVVLGEGSAFAVADLARFRQPDANVVFVTDTTFFSDGSIFSHSANARAFIKSATAPKDLAAIVHHYGVKAPAREVHHNPVPG